MGNSNQQPNKMPNQNDSTQTPRRDDKNFGNNNQKEQIRPGQQNSNNGIKNPNQK